MGKQSKSKQKWNLGKGKVTPVQIAFIVDRYLADNNYTNTLSSFRSEAADLFSKTKGKEAPKGLMGLGDILDEYITLKEQRVMLDQEKRRVEMGMRGMQDVMRAYYSSGAIPPLPSSPPLLPPYAVGGPAPPYFPAPNPSNGSPPPGHFMQGSPLVNSTWIAKPPPKIVECKNFSTPLNKASPANKRKLATPAPKLLPAPKRSCVHSLQDSSAANGNTPPSQVACVNSTDEIIDKISAAQSTVADDIQITSSVQGSSVAKILFKHSSECQETPCSPKTPGRALSNQTNNFISPHEDLLLNDTTDATTSQGPSSSKCSIISSKTVIVSPLKCAGYYAVERSYHVTSSPVNLNLKKPSKREHIRGRLDFDNSDVPTSREKQAEADSYTSSTEGEVQEFDFDLPDLDIFSRDISFSQLLVDLDLDCQPIPCQSTAIPDFLPGSEHTSHCVSVAPNQAALDSCLPSLDGRISEETSLQVSRESVASIRTVTKCTIVSPAKSRRGASSAVEV